MFLGLHRLGYTVDLDGLAAAPNDVPTLTRVLFMIAQAGLSLDQHLERMFRPHDLYPTFFTQQVHVVQSAAYSM